MKKYHYILPLALLAFKKDLNAQIQQVSEKKEEVYVEKRFMDYSLAISMNVPEGTKAETFYTSETPLGRPAGDHILELFLFKGSDMADLYLKKFEGTITEIKEEIKSSYLGDILVRFVVDEKDRLIAEFRTGDKFFYQVYGLLSLNNTQYQYQSNSGNENYSLKRAEKIEMIARSAKY